MKKQILRSLFTQKREELSLDEMQSLSKNVTAQVFRYFKITNKKVSLFLSIDSKKEVQTKLLLTQLLANKNQISVSKSDFSTNLLKHYLYENEAQLAISKFGIPEPKYGKEILPKALNFVFVPLLCFDEKGFRVGYGKGFYDRFLRECNKDCVFIGLSFFDPVSAIEDTHANDIPLHFVVTPQKVYKFFGEFN